MGEDLLSRIPFYVEQASYCVTFHDRNLCTRCTDSGCPRLDEAAALLADYREQRSTRYQTSRKGRTR
ncbi:hypothetical protein OG470_15710 [Micromonospora sp. NBC_00389]|uniref:hypothetical protein n=1 Tax=Micromonospora sp. NBC_00389 TaxID=2903586 RepID=UPI002E210D33